MRPSLSERFLSLDAPSHELEIHLVKYVFEFTAHFPHPVSNTRSRVMVNAPFQRKYRSFEYPGKSYNKQQVT